MTPDDERRAAAVPGVPVADRLRALADAPWSERGDAATQAALREGADAVERLAAVARGAQYREREALATVAVLRTREDARADDVERLDLALAWSRCCEREAVGEVERLRARLDARERVERERVGATQPAGDLAALARREAGSAHQWRQCQRCGRCFWLTPDEMVPPHGWVDPWGVKNMCAAVTVGEGSEGR